MLRLLIKTCFISLFKTLTTSSKTFAISTVTMHAHQFYSIRQYITSHRYCLQQWHSVIWFLSWWRSSKYVTGVNQWLACPSKHHLPPHFKDTSPLSTKIAFGGIGGNKVTVQSLGTVVISMLLPGETFVDYRALLIPNDIPILLGLPMQMRLGMVTQKVIAIPSAKMKAIFITIPVTLKFGRLYFEAVTKQAHYMDIVE